MYEKAFLPSLFLGRPAPSLFDTKRLIQASQSLLPKVTNHRQTRLWSRSDISHDAAPTQSSQNSHRTYCLAPLRYPELSTRKECSLRRLPLSFSDLPVPLSLIARRIAATARSSVLFAPSLFAHFCLKESKCSAKRQPPCSRSRNSFLRTPFSFSLHHAPGHRFYAVHRDHSLGPFV